MARDQKVLRLRETLDRLPAIRPAAETDLCGGDLDIRRGHTNIGETPPDRRRSRNSRR